MSWLGIHGHDAVVDRFRHALATGRLASTFLFVGPPGIGKRTFAQRLAQALLCQKHADRELDACGVCPSCRQVIAGSHTDLEQVALPEGKSFIPLELLIGTAEHRMREGLCHRMALKPASGSRKIAIIDDADSLNREGANCLLKLLEEPPPRAVLLLISTSVHRQLPTIRSRAQVVRFFPLPEELIARLLLEATDLGDAGHSRQLAKQAHGSLARANDLAAPEVWDFRAELTDFLSQRDWDGLDLARRMGGFVDAAGTEPQRRRARLRLLVDLVFEFYAQLVRYLVRQSADGDEVLDRAIRQTVTWWHAGVEAAVSAVERCLEARTAIDANANQATLLASWIDELTQVICLAPSE
jgi:DNA polymerase-3 subunit delta'